MKIHGEKMEEDTVIEKILRSMSSKFNYVVCVIKESNNVKELYIDELHGSFLVHAQKMKHVKEEDHVLIITNGVRISCKGRGRDIFKNAQGRGIRLNKSVIQYFKFHKLGHFGYECHNLKECAKYVDIGFRKMFYSQPMEALKRTTPRITFGYWNLDEDITCVALKHGFQFLTQNSKKI